jgi:hypothetical protein
MAMVLFRFHGWNCSWNHGTFQYYIVKGPNYSSDVEDALAVIRLVVEVFHERRTGLPETHEFLKCPEEAWNIASFNLIGRRGSAPQGSGDFLIRLRT